jgi:hypothetical protein
VAEKPNDEHACDDRSGVDCAMRSFQRDWLGSEDDACFACAPSASARYLVRA